MASSSQSSIGNATSIRPEQQQQQQQHPQHSRKLSLTPTSVTALMTPEELEDEVQTLRRKLQTCVATNKMQLQTIDLLEKQVGIEHDRAVTAESQLQLTQKEKDHLQELLASLTERHEGTLKTLQQTQQDLEERRVAAAAAEAAPKKLNTDSANRIQSMTEEIQELRTQLHDSKNKCSIMASRLVASVRNAQIDEAGEVSFCIRMLEEERESFFNVITALAAEVHLDTSSLRELFENQFNVSSSLTDNASTGGGAPAFVPEMVIKSNEVVNAVRGSLAEMRLTHARTLQTIENAVPFIKEIRKHVERAARIVFANVQAVNPVRAWSLGTTSFVAIGGAQSPPRSDFVEPTPSPRPAESMQSTFSVHHYPAQQQQQQQGPAAGGMNTSYGNSNNNSTMSHQQQQQGPHVSPPPKGYPRGATTRRRGDENLDESSQLDLEAACDFLRATLHAFDDLTKILSSVFPEQRRPGEEDPVETIIAGVERDLQRFVASSNETTRTLSNRISKEIASHRENVAQLRQRLSCAEAEYTSLLMSMHHASPMLLEQLEQHYAAVVAPQPNSHTQLRQPAPSVPAPLSAQKQQKQQQQATPTAAAGNTAPRTAHLHRQQHHPQARSGVAMPLTNDSDVNDDVDSRNSIPSDSGTPFDATAATLPPLANGASLDFPPSGLYSGGAAMMVRQRFVSPAALVSPQF